MQGVGERAVLRLILDKQGGKFWTGMGLEGGCCENCYNSLRFRNYFAETSTFI
jgi:hypothetical protein